MLERPPGGTTIRRPAGLMGMSSGVGGPGQGQKERKISRLHEKRTHEVARVEKNVSQFKEQTEPRAKATFKGLWSVLQIHPELLLSSTIENWHHISTFQISSKHSNNCCHILASFKTQEVFQDTLLLTRIYRTCHWADRQAQILVDHI